MTTDITSKLEAVKGQFKQVLGPVIQKYQDKVKGLRIRLTEQHQVQVAQMAAQHALFEGEIDTLLGDMEAEEAQFEDKLELFDQEWKELVARQKKLKETVTEQIQNDLWLSGRIKKSATCQTLKLMLDSKDGESQTSSIKKIFEDYEEEKK